ncbi:beta-defensin 123 [Phaenicophaeus curvirostris]|uniref:beta-defensin 123 n=1 Tax=Phaenicophaeus curvirostris TaxID=33595 RepID=UPI0037F0A64E
MRVLCVVFSVLLLFSLAIPGGCMPKGICSGYCSYTCAKRDEWSLRHSCGKKKYCCIPLPKKGK